MAELDAHAVAVKAYVYLYPLVTMELTRLQATNVATAEERLGHAPMNAFHHVRAFPPDDFKIVVRVNFDTLYSAAFVDLAGGPIVVSVGEDTDGRFYELPMYDMWTDAFAAPGQRTSGTGAGSWALVPPGWTGVLPDGVERIEAPTPTVWIIGRTQTNGPDDYPNVHRFQDSLSLVPLASWGSDAPPITGSVDPAIDMVTPPLDAVNAMSASEFFDQALALLATHPPHATDWSLIAQMKRIGLAAGARFSDLVPSVQHVLADVPRDAQAAMQRFYPHMANVVNGWQMNVDTMGVYGNSYMKRAVITMIGLGANAADDAVYPILMHDADGEPLVGEHDYVLHFEPGELPPVDAFWSVTMYDDEGFQAANPIGRFAIGDRDPLRYNDDGSLDLYLQHETPGPEREANWLPAPTGRLGVTMRLYSPKEIVVNGEWSPPPVRKA